VDEKAEREKRKETRDERTNERTNERTKESELPTGLSSSSGSGCAVKAVAALASTIEIWG
jgi:hypothetical protein